MLPRLVMIVAAQPSILSRWPALQQIAAALGSGAPRVEAEGLWGSARALAVAALLHESPRPAVLLEPGQTERQRAALDLRFFLASLEPLSEEGAGRASGERRAPSGTLPPGHRVLEFPAPQPARLAHGRHRERDAERALVCHRLGRGERVAVVTTPAALSAPLLSPADFRARSLSLVVGASLDREALVEHLHAAGYERVETVVEVGQWSQRGGIVDVFSPARERPVRAEFLGDEVESLRLFDPTTQRSLETLREVTVLPLPAGGAAPGGRLMDYLPAGTLAVLGEPGLLEAPPDEAPAAEPLAEILAPFQRLELPLLRRGAAPGDHVAMGARTVGTFRGQFSTLALELGRRLREGYTVRLVVDDEGQAGRLRQILSEHGLEAWPEASLWGSEGLGVLVGDCAVGFELPALGLLVLTEEEVFGARRRRLRRPLFQRGAAIASFTDVAPGDLVVHEAHGIGRYHDLRRLSVEGRDADFLLLEYAEGGRLYLPVERLDVISKYMGPAGVPTRLDRLGGSAWQRVKESVRASLREMAEGLLRLYAARSVAERSGFSADTPWQREFEAAFRFEETPDQLQAIEAVKADMEGARPMDRLVAGDAGYGKTEVALRAAFKAVADGRQVAVLVPTTVLAQQHFNTFVERFGAFPARVELLSRFRSAREQKAVVEGLRRGAVDVVIGTHRLLSGDVQFKDLGLLVVDEEHRFGVGHKERIKRLRASVDVLTLTATPIPRTLHMSLAGVRDLSLIDTPPPDRLPVETMVAPFDRSLVKEAIASELERGGQVFFVHNRVQSLPSMTAFVKGLCPGARVVMAHGQMGERELEGVMVKFVNGQADILVSTAIVESGLDIPASNTIIINRADRLGLAQLYQLRGRVGRERQQAYAYLLIPAGGHLDEGAQRRLRVIEELTGLGAGFKLALRDLEIRGSGNLLGPEQHGHIAAVGFDLYTKLLAEAVGELRGQPAQPSVEPLISVEVEARLPAEYVPEVSQRLGLYKRLSESARAEEIAEIGSELADRFGPLPPAAAALLDVAILRTAARALGIERIEARGGVALLTFAPSTPVAPEQILAAIARSRGRMAMRREYTVEARIPEAPWGAVYTALDDLLASLRPVLP